MQVRFDTPRAWRRALDSEWATGRCVVRTRQPLRAGEHLQVRVLVLEEALDLRGIVVKAPVALEDQRWDCLVGVRWTDGLRLRAEAMTQADGGDSSLGGNPGDSFFGAQNPAVDINVTDSVPPFWITPPDLSRLPGGGESDLGSANTPMPEAPSIEKLTAIRQQIGGARYGAAREEAPPARSERAQRVFEEALEAERRGDHAHARRRAVLALAYAPTDAEIRDYIDTLDVVVGESVE